MQYCNIYGLNNSSKTYHTLMKNELHFQNEDLFLFNPPSYLDTNKGPLQYIHHHILYRSGIEINTATPFYQKFQELKYEYANSHTFHNQDSVVKLKTTAVTNRNLITLIFSNIQFFQMFPLTFTDIRHTKGYDTYIEVPHTFTNFKKIIQGKYIIISDHK
jgi:hypothetical protein